MPEATVSEAMLDAVVATALRLLGSCALGAIVGMLYRTSRDPESRNPGFSQTLVLLAPLITMVTMAVGQNVAAAFTLVGTLAIVRFRSAIRDTRDMAFLIFAVAVGMAIGTFDLVVALAGVLVVGALVVAIRGIERNWCRRQPIALLRIAISPVGADPSAYDAMLARYVSSWRVVRASVDRQTDILELRLCVSGLDPGRATGLLVELATAEGVVRAAFVGDDGA